MEKYWSTKLNFPLRLDLITVENEVSHTVAHSRSISFDSNFIMTRWNKHLGFFVQILKSSLLYKSNWILGTFWTDLRLFV